MRSIISFVTGIVMSILLVGCVARTPAPQQPDAVVLDLIDQADDDDQPYVPEEEPVNIWTQDDTKDSSWDGIFAGTVRIEQRIELDPWAFAGDENYESKVAGCEQQLARNELTDACPTNTVLYAVALDGETLPKELVASVYSPLEEDITEIIVGCIGEDGWYAAPLWDFRINLNGIVSINDQEKLLAAAEAGAQVPVRITKRAYDIPGRGGTACDIAFTRLQVVSE